MRTGTLAAVCAASALLACACAGARPRTPADLVASRPYPLLVPATYARGRPAPLVVLLHGYGSNGAHHLEYFGLAEVAARRGWLVAFPDGTRNRDGRRFWNASTAYGSDVDDVAYLGALVDDVARRYDVDPKRVFFIGHSNGAFMAHRMACERADRVRGVVALAGGIPGDLSRCRPSQPVPVLQVHGDADELVPYGGGLGFNEELFPSARASVETWAKLDGCSGGLARTSDPRLDLDARVPGPDTRVERAACARGAAELWTIEGGVHTPELRIPAWGNAILDWLEAQAARPGARPERGSGGGSPQP